MAYSRPPHHDRPSHQGQRSPEQRRTDADVSARSSVFSPDRARARLHQDLFEPRTPGERLVLALGFAMLSTFASLGAIAPLDAERMGEFAAWNWPIALSLGAIAGTFMVVQMVLALGAGWCVGQGTPPAERHAVLKAFALHLVGLAAAGWALFATTSQALAIAGLSAATASAFLIVSRMGRAGGLLKFAAAPNALWWLGATGVFALAHP